MKRILCILLLLLILPAGSLGQGREYDPNYPSDLIDSDLSCTSAILLELDSGRVLYEKNADAIVYPASTTKILTTLLALSMGDLNQMCYVSPTAVAIPEDSSRIGLQAGENIALIDLLYATMVISGNDGANVIAENIGGSIPEFVDLMNRAAEAMGCVSTHFANPHGYHDENHYTTARDLATITCTAMENNTFRLIANTKTYTVPATNLSGSRTLNSTNRLINYSEEHASRFYKYANGIKTGQHSAAGYCLAASAVKDGVQLISIVLNASSDAARYRDTIRLFEYGFTQFLSTSIYEIYQMNPRVIDISRFDLDDPQLGRLELSLRRVNESTPDLIVTTEQEMQYWLQNFNILTHTEYTRSFRAPVTAGEVMGTLTYYPEQGNEVVYELIATRSIAARPALAPSIDEITQAAIDDPNPFPRFTFELFMRFILLPLLVLLIFFRLLRRLRRKLKKRTHIRNMTPHERYYR